jgi:hypothetical protein
MKKQEERLPTKKDPKKKGAKSKSALKESARETPKIEILRENKKLIAGGALVLLIIIFASLLLFNRGPEIVSRPPVNMSFVKDLGAVSMRGDGLPGYDIDRSGEADYLSKGFGYYKEIYASGGFEYGPGEIELKELETVITLPILNFAAEEIVESGVGSVVSFSAEDEATGTSILVILKTLGPSLTTYNLFIDDYQGESYGIIDVIGGEGSGIIEEKEIEIVGSQRFFE